MQTAVPIPVFPDVSQEVVRTLESLLRDAPPALVLPAGPTLAQDHLTPRIVAAGAAGHASAWAALPVPETEDDNNVLEPVALFAARELTIGPGTVLRLDGPPTIMLVEHLTIIQGGTLEVLVRARLHVGTLRKLDQEDAS
jgi:hypothetical protein